MGNLDGRTRTRYNIRTACNTVAHLTDTSQVITQIIVIIKIRNASKLKIVYLKRSIIAKLVIRGTARNEQQFFEGPDKFSCLHKLSLGQAFQRTNLERGGHVRCPV